MSSAYKALPEGSIRLLKLHSRRNLRPNSLRRTDDLIQCSLKVYQFDDPSLPSYVALSYVWGPEQPAFEIMMGVRKISVRKNLYEFLLQKTGDELLWIDALCIDQKNDQERSDQVRRMGEIYARADRTIAWLGPADHEGLRNALLHLREADWKVPDMPAPELSEPSELKKHLEQLLTPYVLLRAVESLQYWSRCWVVQELVLAKNLDIRYGDVPFRLPHHPESQFDCKIYIALLKSLSNFAVDKQATISHLGHLPTPWDGSHILTLQSQRREYHDNLGPVRGLMDLLRFNHTRKCQEPRDRIYSLLSLVDQEERDRITVDYTSDDREVFCTVLAGARMEDITTFTYGHTLIEVLGLSTRWHDYPKPVSTNSAGRCLEVSGYICAEVVEVMELANDRTDTNGLQETWSTPDVLEAISQQFSNEWHSEWLNEFIDPESYPGKHRSRFGTELSLLRELEPWTLNDTLHLIQSLESRQAMESKDGSRNTIAPHLSTSITTIVALRSKRLQNFDVPELSSPEFVMCLGQGRISVGDQILRFPGASATTAISISRGSYRGFTGVVRWGKNPLASADLGEDILGVGIGEDGSLRPRSFDNLREDLKRYERVMVKLRPEEILQLILDR